MHWKFNLSFHCTEALNAHNACCRLGGRDIGAELAPLWKQWLIKNFGVDSCPANAQDTDAGKTAVTWANFSRTGIVIC